MKKVIKAGIASPKVAGSAYLSPSAQVTGNVVIGNDVFVGPHTVLRADEPGSKVVIAKGCNIQDGVIVHALKNTKVTVGEHTSLTHGCIIHGPCKIGKDVFIGFRSVIFDSNIGSNSVVKNMCHIEGVDIPAGRTVPSCSNIDLNNASLILGKTSAKEKNFSRSIVKVNKYLIKAYKGKKIRTAKTHTHNY
ncbi:MAG: carbonate dehydratase [Candidatus Firestonebacteria bacterium]|nr:carbonate dehydratase [Candidatus Firestonebacteria bacterium]